MIGSAKQYALPEAMFWQGRNRRCGANENEVSDIHYVIPGRAKREPGMTVKVLTPRPQFQALQPGSDVDADLTLQAERLQRNGIA